MINVVLGEVKSTLNLVYVYPDVAAVGILKSVASFSLFEGLGTTSALWSSYYNYPNVVS